MRLLICIAFFGIVALANTPAQSEDIWLSWPCTQVPESPPADEILRLKCEWRLDCGVDSDEVVGQIRAATPGLNGRVLLLDRQLCRVLVVSESGSIERVFGQPGEGPGDLPGAFRVFQLPDGRIGVSGGAPAFSIQFGGTGKIVLLDAANLPAGVWKGAGDPGTMPVCSVRELRCSSGNVLVASHGMMVARSGAVRVEELSILNGGDGERTVVTRREFVEDTSSLEVNERDHFEPFAHGRCDISSSGRVAFAPYRDEWLVAIREADETGWSLSRKLKPIERTDASKKAMHEKLGGTSDCSVLDTEPVIGRIRWRPTGNLWVEPFGVEPAEEAIACFDEFSSEGNLLRRVQVVVPNLKAGDQLLVLEDGRFVLLSGWGGAEEIDTTDRGRAEVALLVIE
jgi:hypothetical protein